MRDFILASEIFSNTTKKENYILVFKINSQIISLYEEFLEFQKKYNFSHFNSAFSIIPIYLNLIYNNNFKNIFLGKPFGFSSFLFLMKKFHYLIEPEFNIIISELKKLNFDGVLTQKQLNHLLKFETDIYKFEEFKKFLREIKYIDSTLGSVLGVAQGYAFSNPKNKINVIISDSLFYMGEFLEEIMLINDFNFNNIYLHIDYNQNTKQNKIKINVEEINKLLKNFNYTIYFTKFLKEFPNYEKNNSCAWP